MVTQEQINDFFMEAVRYLKSKGYSQKDIVTKSGIAQNAISKIKNGENNAGDETIRKVAQAFRLNIPFFYGNSPHISLLDMKREVLDNELDETRELLVRIQSEEHKDKAAEDIDPKPFIPSWADSFFDIMTQQIKQNETLNRELRQSIAEVAALTKQLTELIKTINK
jgi:transcriptional regulator with XRE-family HTH domain